MASASDSRPTKSDSPNTAALGPAVVKAWRFWAASAVSLALTTYFYTTETLVREMNAEIFYAILFAFLTVLAVGGGVYDVRKRMNLFGF